MNFLIYKIGNTFFISNGDTKTEITQISNMVFESVVNLNFDESGSDFSVLISEADYDNILILL